MSEFHKVTIGIGSCVRPFFAYLLAHGGAFGRHSRALDYEPGLKVTYRSLLVDASDTAVEQKTEP